MNLQFLPSDPANNGGISLQDLVKNFLDTHQVFASKHSSEIINEVGKSMILRGTAGRIISLLEEVVQTVILNSEGGDIRIGAERKGDKLIMKIQERNNNNGYALSFSLGSLKGDISKAGADLMIVGHQTKVTTIYFSFSDKNVA